MDKNYEYKSEIKSLKRKLNSSYKMIERMKKLIDVNTSLGSSLNKKEVLKRILEETKELMNCKNSSVLLVDPVTNQLCFDVVSNEEEMDVLSEIRLNMGEGVAGVVWSKGKPIILNDVNKDSRFSKKVDEKSNLITRSIIAIPLVVDGKIIGVMEAINKEKGKKFNDFDLDIFTNLSVQAAIAIQNAQLYDMAITDGKTKLYIHKYFETRLFEEYIRAERYNKELTVVMLDIDHFKKINDTYGHQFGDEVLIKIADVIKSTCRVCDIAARFGGEEFSIILPETNKDNGFLLSERLRKKVEDLEFEHEGQLIKITISGGVSTYPDNNSKNSKNLLEQADKALYNSKGNGRNKVTAFIG